MVGQHGPPTEVQIFLFAFGAACGYGGLRLLTWETGGEAQTPLPRSPNLVRAGLVHLAAIGAAVGVAIAVAQVESDAAWFVAMLLATLLYLAVSSVESAKVESGDESASGD
jgi:hypothetical protein